MAEWISALLRRCGSVREAGAGDALASTAAAWLAQGVRETEGSNAGPDVSWMIHDGGGTPGKRPPWCAYFVSSVCRQVERAGLPITYTRTGRAVSHWQKADPVRRIMPDEVWAEDARGLVMVRTRLSNDASEAQKARDGMLRQGHCAIVVDISPESRTVDLIAGNSSGHGHNKISGSGAVARETIKEGDAAWNRLVGFVRVCSP